MADLVDRQRLGLAQLAVRPEGLFLEEAAHRVVRAEEPVIAGAFLVARGEDGARLAGVEGVDDVLGTPAQRRDLVEGLEVGEDDEAVALEAGALFGCQHGVRS